MSKVSQRGQALHHRRKDAGLIRLQHWVRAEDITAIEQVLAPFLAAAQIAVPKLKRGRPSAPIFLGYRFPNATGAQRECLKAAGFRFDRNENIWALPEQAELSDFKSRAGREEFARLLRDRLGDDDFSCEPVIG